MDNLWNKPGIPHKGWDCINVIDIKYGTSLMGYSGYMENSKYETCMMCNHERIRYVHIMKHKNYPHQIRSGRICAAKMCEDYSQTSTIEREKRLKSKSGARSRWIKGEWKVSEKGNLYRKKSGVIYGVNQYTPGIWSYFVIEWGKNPHYSSKKFNTENESKLTLFEEYWERLDSH